MWDVHIHTYICIYRYLIYERIPPYLPHVAGHLGVISVCDDI